MSSPSAMAALPALTWVPVVVLGALLCLALTAPAVASAAAWPLALAGVAVGIPHGAVDHLVPWWWSRGGGTAPRRRAAVAAFAAGYAAVALVGAGALVLAPDLAFAVFLVVAVVHFGRGEVVAWAERDGRPAPGPLADVLPAAAHGLAVVGPLAWAPPASSEQLRSLAPGLARALALSRGPGLALVVGLSAVAVAGLLRSGRRGEAGELGLVATTFLVAPALAAFGLYFGAWHALRHTGRLLDLARGQLPPGRASWPAAARRLAASAAWPSTVAALAVLAVVAGRHVAGVQAEVSVLLALTFPHAALVWLLDRREADLA